MNRLDTLKKNRLSSLVKKVTPTQKVETLFPADADPNKPLDFVDYSAIPSTNIPGIADPKDVGGIPTPTFRQRAEKAFQRGKENAALDFLWRREMLGEVSEAEATAAEKRIEELNKTDPVEGRNFVENLLLKTVAITPPMIKGYEQGMAYGTVGAGGAFVGGQFGPQVALPEEIITVPAAYSAGLTIGGVKYWSEQGQGSIYRQARKAGVSKKTATIAASIGGPIYGWIEHSQIDRIIPGLSRVKGGLSRLILRFATNYATEVGEEGLQKGVEEIAVKTGQLIEGQIKAADIPNEVKATALSSLNEMKEAAGPMAVLQLPGAGISAGRIAEGAIDRQVKHKVERGVRTEQTIRKERQARQELFDKDVAQMDRELAEIQRGTLETPPTVPIRVPQQAIQPQKPAEGVELPLKPVQVKPETKAEQIIEEPTQYKTKTGKNVESPTRLYGDGNDLTLAELRKMSPDEVISVKRYSAKRGGVARGKIKVGNLILPELQAQPPTKAPDKDKRGQAPPANRLEALKETAKKKTIEDLRAKMEEDVSDEELSGITKPERRKLIKENAAKIEKSDIYHTEVDAMDTMARQVGAGYYYINKGYRGEVEAIIGKRKGFPTKIQSMFTFNPNDKKIVTLPTGEKAAIGPTPWERAVQEGLGRGKEGIEQTHGEMDISEFVQRVVDAYQAGNKIGGVYKNALERAEQSGEPDIQMLAEKHRMLVEGFSDQQINEMISEWAGEWGIDVEDIESEFVNEYGTKIRRIKRMEDPDAALEQLATEQIELEDRQAAAESAREVLEANDIQAEVEQVEEIPERPIDLIGRPLLQGGAVGKQRGLGELGLEFTKPEAKDPDQMEFGDTIPFEMRGRPVGAAITQGEKQIILLAYGADSETGYHEGYHILRRRLNEKNTKVLDKYFKGDEEAEARAFAEYIKTGKTKTFLRGIWQKLRNLLRKVKSGLTGRGFRTAEDIFGAIRRGTIAKQAPRGAGIAFETRPVFYSKLERAVANMPAKMSRESFRNWANKQGIKKEEMLWSGVTELLNKNPKVTKQQVLDTIAANNIQIEEVTKGGEGVTGETDLHIVQEELTELSVLQDEVAQGIYEQLVELPEDVRRKISDEAGGPDEHITAAAATGRIGTSEEQSQRARDDLEKYLPDIDWDRAYTLASRFYELKDEQRRLMSRETEGPQFAQYTLPGGENYTELLLRWAAPTIDRATRRIKEGYAAAHQMHSKDIEGISRKIREGEYIGGRAADIGAPRTLEYYENRRAELERILEEMTEPVGPTSEIYRSPHWKETNILAHIRFTDRWTRGERRVLFIEEIQSDWHQIGRKRGYRIPIDTTGWTATLGSKGVTADIYTVRDAEGNERWHPIANSEKEAIERAAAELHRAEAVPDAPFKKTWHELALKRMLRYAAENGYDQLAWTTGEQQAERYDLSKQVSKVALIEDWGGEGKHLLQAYDLGGVLRLNQSGVTEDKLADYIGKEAAERLLKAEFKEIPEHEHGPKRRGRVLSGLDLKVGGEGMKAFYDRMVPSFLRKYAKKWGARIGTTKIEAGRTVEGEPVDVSIYKDVDLIGGRKVYETVPTMSITPKMKESVLAGQVQFETSSEKARREVDKKARIKARKARLAAQVGIKRKRRGRQAPRIRIKLQDHTPPLREDLAPIKKAELPPAEERPLKTRTLTRPVYTEKWFEANLKREKRSILDKAGSEARRVWIGLEKVFSSSSTRLNNIAPRLFRATRQYIYDVLTRSTAMTEEVSDFVKASRKMAKDDWRQLDLAFKNGIDWKIDQIVGKYNLTEGYQTARAVLDELYDAAKEVGIDIDYRKNYWPRVLKDPEGFLMYFQGREDWSIIEEAIKRRAEQAGRKIEDLTVDEKAHVVNTLLRGYRTQALTLSRPGPSKERTVESIDKVLDAFYDDSRTALFKYIKIMNAKIAEREFFGRETKEIQKLRKTQSARLTRLLKLKRRVGLKYPSEPKYKEHISKTAQNWKEGQERLERLKARPLSETIGGFVLQLQAEGQISPSQEKQVQDILRGIFDPQRMSSRMGVFATGIYIDTLNSPLQALTQLDEFAYSFYSSPLKSIPVAIRTAARKSKITPRDIGITSIGEEFQGPSMKRGLSLLLKSTGFEMIDRLNKENYINTVLSKYQSQAKRKTLNASFANRLRKVFGDEYKGVVEDLRNNRISDNVKYLLFNEILDIQPIAITEMPEAYNKAGNMRILYSLKTFYMKRLDFIRNECFKDMRSPKTFARGFGKLLWLAFSFALMGAGSDALKDFIRGKDFDLTDSIVDNLLRMAFFSKYQAWRTREKGLGTALLEGWRPPTKAIDALTRDIINEAQGKERGWELWRSVPIVGENYYWWFGEGRRKTEAREEESPYPD